MELFRRLIGAIEVHLSLNGLSRRQLLQIKFQGLCFGMYIGKLWRANWNDVGMTPWKITIPWKVYSCRVKRQIKISFGHRTTLAVFVHPPLGLKIIRIVIEGSFFLSFSSETLFDNGLELNRSKNKLNLDNWRRNKREKTFSISEKLEKTKCFLSRKKSRPLYVFGRKYNFLRKSRPQT